jgi:GNAT superfamily N-acetyltransferase
MTPALPELFEALEATWPAEAVIRQGPWCLRDGQGGGKRVSAATASALVGPAEIARAAAAMRGMGQRPLFMIRADDAALDADLAALGYEMLDPTNILVCPVSRLTDVPLPRVTAFTIWEPLAIMREIWVAGGVGPERLAVMARAKTKTALFARHRDKPAGVGFVGLSGRIAMVHAVEVLPPQRRQGVAAWIMRAAAFWAQAQGAETLAVLATQANTGAGALYSALGFVKVGQYHYRQKPTESATTDA